MDNNNPQVPVETSSTDIAVSDTASSQPHLNKKLLIIAGVMITLLLISTGAGAYYLGSQKDNNSSSQKNQTINILPTATSNNNLDVNPTMVSTASSIKQNSELLGWQTINSSRCNISIHYPPEWSAKVTGLVPGTNDPKYDYGCLTIQAPDYKELPTHGREGFYLTISRTEKGAVFKNITVNSLDTFIKAEENIWEPPTPVTNLQNVTYGDHKGKSFVFGGMTAYNYFIFDDENYIYSILSPAEYQGEYDDILPKIISSLKKE